MRTVSRVAVAATATTAAIVLLPLASPRAHAADRVVCGSLASYAKGAPYTFEAAFRSGRTYHGTATVPSGGPDLAVKLTGRAPHTLVLVPDGGRDRAMLPMRTASGMLGVIRLSFTADTYQCAPDGRLLAAGGPSWGIGRPGFGRHHRRVSTGHWALRSRA